MSEIRKIYKLEEKMKIVTEGLSGTIQMRIVILPDILKEKS
ncbi:MAG: hypothetical protein ACYDAO_05805 [Thermoplasmataceae archaeon]